MSGRTYHATGVNLKSSPLGEADRILTILTPEFGLIKAVVPGARKGGTTLSALSGLFVVNNLLIAKGRSIDKVIQAQSIEQRPGLGQNLGKLSASQYLAELAITEASSKEPQLPLFTLLNEHLTRIDKIPHNLSPIDERLSIIACLVHGIFHLLAIEGIAPQVQACCVSRHPVSPDFTDPDWRIQFSISTGGIITEEALNDYGVNIQEVNGITIIPMPKKQFITHYLKAEELAIFQELSMPEIKLELIEKYSNLEDWQTIERLLRQYIQYYLDYSVRSATLIDTYLNIGFFN